MMSDLWQRLQREVKANGKKAGLLAGLFLFGCCFWVPMLTRAAVPKRAPAAIIPSTASSTPAIANGQDVPTTVEAPGKFWSNLTNALANDPMYRSVDVQSFTRDPFQLAEVSEPLPVLITEEPKPKAEVKSEQDTRQLELNSTIIGRSRRAALINGQLYQLGRQIQANGLSYQLTAIESHRVVLSSGKQTIVLTLARTQLKDVLDGGDAIVPPPQ